MEKQEDGKRRVPVRVAQHRRKLKDGSITEVSSHDRMIQTALKLRRLIRAEQDKIDREESKEEEDSLMD